MPKEDARSLRRRDLDVEALRLVERPENKSGLFAGHALGIFLAGPAAERGVGPNDATVKRAGCGDIAGGVMDGRQQACMFIAFPEAVVFAFASYGRRYIRAGISVGRAPRDRNSEQDGSHRRGDTGNGNEAAAISREGQ